MVFQLMGKNKRKSLFVQSLNESDTYTPHLYHNAFTNGNRSYPILVKIIFMNKPFSNYSHVPLWDKIGVCHGILSNLFFFLLSIHVSAEYRTTVFDKYCMIFAL